MSLLELHAKAHAAPLCGAHAGACAGPVMEHEKPRCGPISLE